MSDYNITLEDLLRAWGDVIKARHLYLRYRNPKFSTDSGVDNEWSALNHEDYMQALLADHRNGIDFRALPSEWYKYVLNAEREFSNLADKYALQLANSLPNGLALLDNIHAHRNYLYAKGKRDALFPETLDFSSPLWTNGTQLVFDWEYVHDQNKAQGALHLVNADTDLAPYYDLVDAINRYNAANEAEAQRRLSMQDYSSGTVEDQRRLVSDQLTDATYVDLPLSRIIPIINAPKIEQQQQYYLDQYNEPYPWEERLSPEQIEQIANAYEMMSGVYAPFGSPGMSSMLSHSREWALAHPYLAQEIVNTAIDINPPKVAIEQLPWFAAPAIIGSGIRAVGTALKGVNSLSKVGEWTYNIGNKLGRLLSIAEADRVAGILADEGTEGVTEALTRAAEAYTAPEGVPITNDVAINLGNGEFRTVNPVREVKVPSTAESIAGRIEPEVVDLEIKPKIDIPELTTREAAAYDSTLDDLVEALTKNGFNEEDIVTLSPELMKDLVTAEIENGAKNTTEAINNVKRAIATIASGAATLAMAAGDGNEEENSSGVSKSAIGIGLTVSAYILSNIFFRMKRPAPGASSRRALFWRYEGKGNKPKKVRLKDREYQYNLLLKELVAAMSEPEGLIDKKLALIKKIEDRGIILEGETTEDKINEINEDMKDVRHLLVKGDKSFFTEGSKYDKYTKSDESILGEKAEENDAAKAITSKDKYLIKNRRARNVARGAFLGAMATGIGLTAYDMISDHQVKKRQKSADEEAVLNDTNSTLPIPQGASQDSVAQPIDSTRIRIFENIVTLLPDSLKENKTTN